MKQVKRLLSLVVALAMLLGCTSMTALADNGRRPTKVRIVGKTSSITVGATRELEIRLTPTGADVDDSRVRWKSSNTNVLKVLENYDDETKIKALKAGKAKITVSILGTSIKHSVTITVKKKTSATSAQTKKFNDYKKKISAYRADADEIGKSIQNLKVASTQSDRQSQHRTIEKKIDALDLKEDMLENQIVKSYRSEKLTETQYSSLKKLLDALEDKLDTLEDALDLKLDSDDYDDDYDDYDDDYDYDD